MAKKKPSSADEDQVVLDYLTKVNRPYSATDIYNNLHGKYQKPTIVKALERLVEEQMVVSKTYGKMSIYTIKQNKEDVPSNEELDAMQLEIEKLEKELEELKKERSTLSKTLATLTEQPTTTEAKVILNTLQAENEALKERLEKVASGAVLVPEDKKGAVQAEYDKMRKEWKQRRRLFKNIMDTISEHLPNNPRELKEELGIEDDPVPFEHDPLA